MAVPYIRFDIISHRYSIVIPLLSHYCGFVGNTYLYDHDNKYDNDEYYHDHYQIGWYRLEDSTLQQEMKRQPGKLLVKS